jgi:hypothetical protein
MSDKNCYDDKFKSSCYHYFADTLNQLVSCRSGVKLHISRAVDSGSMCHSLYSVSKNGRSLDFVADCDNRESSMRIRKRNQKETLANPSLSDFYVDVPLKLVNDYEGMSKLLDKGLLLKR